MSNKTILQSNNSALSANNVDLQSLIDQANALPDAGGVELPTLTSPASEEEIFSGKEVIDQEGNVKTGTFTISTELSEQDMLIAQIQMALEGKAGGGGNTDIEDAMVTGTLTEYTNSRVANIGNYVFAYCYSLASVSFPACTSVGMYAFAYCYSLASVSFPACSRISRNAFAHCSSLTSASFPVCTSIGNSAFQNCSKLTSASFPACTSIGGSAFANCSKLTTVSFPACTSIDSNAFQSCTKLTSVSFPVCTSIGSSAFYSCYSLATISFPKCANISSYAFNRCRSLSSLTLGASTVCTLVNSNAFSSTPYAGYSSYFSGTPYIYVPASLVASYQAATNWTYFSSYFSSTESLSGGNLISFTINGTEYQAEEGMTWSEWVDSEYNTISAFITGNYVIAMGTPIDGVLSADIIVNGASYIVPGGGGAG